MLHVAYCDCSNNFRARNSTTRLLLRFHEILLFLRAYPHNAAIVRDD